MMRTLSGSKRKADPKSLDAKRQQYIKKVYNALLVVSGLRAAHMGFLRGPSLHCR